MVVDTDFHPLEVENRRRSGSSPACEPVTIGDDVFIGAHAVVLKGVTIGNGAVVGAMSVVTEDVPPATIVAGNPARVVGEITQG